MEKVNNFLGNRKRKSINFSMPERQFLIELIKSRIDILENKLTDAFSNKAKEAAWNELSLIFNSSHVCIATRQPEQLRACWLNMKKAAKKRLQEDRSIRLCKASGGIAVSAAEELDYMIEDICAWQYSSLQNEADDDAMVHEKIAKSSDSQSCITAPTTWSTDVSATSSSCQDLSEIDAIISTVSQSSSIVIPSQLGSSSYRPSLVTPQASLCNPQIDSTSSLIFGSVGTSASSLEVEGSTSKPSSANFVAPTSTQNMRKALPARKSFFTAPSRKLRKFSDDPLNEYTLIRANFLQKQMSCLLNQEKRNAELHAAQDKRSAELHELEMQEKQKRITLLDLQIKKLQKELGT